VEKKGNIPYLGIKSVVLLLFTFRKILECSRHKEWETARGLSEITQNYLISRLKRKFNNDSNYMKILLPFPQRKNSLIIVDKNANSQQVVRRSSNINGGGVVI
jgi:hypothetical protein